MRILRYDLTAFGSFTGHSLDLSAPGVHLVMGPNEAGKSTALHALAQLLYGIDVQSRYDFVHPKSELRLGALLQGSDASTLEIVRTKSRKRPLIDPDGAPVDEGRLGAMLGWIDRDTFRTEFALSSTELRAGGRALASGGGQIGQALAASRSGLVLTEVQKSIEALKSDLYKHAGSRPPINVRLRELRESRARVRDASLLPDRFLSLQREVEKARAELDDISADLAAARTDHTRLDRLRQALPGLARHRSLLTELDAIGGAERLAPEDVAERLPELMAELDAADRAATATTNRIDGLAAQLTELSIDERLLTHFDEIERLAQERQAVEDAAQLLARSAGTADELRAEAERLLARVHPEGTLADDVLFEVSEAVRARAQELHDKSVTLDATFEQSRRAQAERRRRFDEAEQRLAALPAPPDSETLRAALAAVPANLLDSMTDAQERALRHRAKADRISGALRLAALPEALITPSPEEVGAHVEARRQLKSDRRDLAKRTKAMTARSTEQELELASLLREDPPPTAADLAAARTARDELWAAVRGAGRPEPAATGEDRAQAYERAVEHADLVADRRFQGAETVATRRKLELDIAKAGSEQIALAAEQAELDQRAAELAAEWAALWDGYAGPVPAPDAGAATLDSVRDLRETLSDLDDARSSLDALRAQAVQHITRLRELLDDSADPVTGNVLAELPELQDIAATRLKENDAAATERAAAQERVLADRDEMLEADAQVADQQALQAEWAQDWKQVLHEIGLPAERETVGALGDLDRLAKVAAKQSEADRIRRDAEQAADRVEQFHDALRRVADACERPLPIDKDEWYDFVGHLHTDAKADHDLASRRAHLLAEQANLRTELQIAQETEQRLHAELDGVHEKAGTDGIDALAEAVRRRQRHTELTGKLSEVAADIVLGAETLEDLSAQAARTDPDELTTRLTGLKEQMDDLETRRDGAQKSYWDLKRELDDLDGSAEAARAAAEVENTAATLVEETEEYLRLEVAHAILRDYIEGYRNAQQDPVLQQAGRLFRELTADRFSGLELDQEAQEPTVVARRANGDLLHTRDLSEGTSDQLYLALRLASLERYAEENRGLPLTLDDVFMTFDDGRICAALKVLDGMADRFQMIVFTHHRHVAKLALDTLPDGRVHVHTLPEFQPPATNRT